MSQGGESILSAGWRPKWRLSAGWGFLVAAAMPGRLAVVLELPSDSDRTALKQWLAQWIVAWIERSDADLAEDEVSYIYVVLTRRPRPSDAPDGSITEYGPVAEAGLGSAPSAPDEWETPCSADLVRLVAADLQA